MWIVETPNSGDVQINVAAAVADLVVDFSATVEAEDYFEWELANRKLIIAKRDGNANLDYERSGILNSVRRKHEKLGSGKLVTVPMDNSVSFRGSICTKSIRLVADSEPEQSRVKELLAVLHRHSNETVSLRHLG